MNLFEKISTQIKGALHDSADAVATEHAGRTARQIVRDLEIQIDKARNSFAEVKATYTLIHKDIEAAEKEIGVWQGRAEKAVAVGKDDLAKEALAEKRKIQSKLDALKKQDLMLKPQIDSVEKHIDEMVAKRDDLMSRADMLQANADVANAVEHAATIATGVGGPDVSAEFDKLERAVDKKMATAEAKNSMTSSGAKEVLENKFTALDSVATVEDELAAIKEKQKK